MKTIMLFIVLLVVAISCGELKQNYKVSFIVYRSGEAIKLQETIMSKNEQEAMDKIATYYWTRVDSIDFNAILLVK